MIEMKPHPSVTKQDKAEDKFKFFATLSLEPPPHSTLLVLIWGKKITNH